ncbi:hypothetical protein [Deinococcus sp. S9]|uniref:hypothetical protein n=1 Tax=Deinococcus sp. S9 TaxID=2545754 RepID=UPI00105670F8|nr:hypothetical protein [Deinococcus sp. S9]TDE84654.1 hypothetical protein E0686_16010 [Deinococcus sp. S9]
MQAIYVGVKKPYTSAKNGKTYFGAYFARPVADAPDCVEILEVDCSAGIHAKLLTAEQGSLLDIDLAPRVFAGRVQGMDLVAING